MNRNLRRLGLLGLVWMCGCWLKTEEPIPVYFVAEIEKGSREKWEFRGGRFVLDRELPQSIDAYPQTYGFVPNTVAEDGDPLDALLVGPPRPRGWHGWTALVGVLRMKDEKGDDPKVLLRPADGPDWTHQDRQALASFFENYKQHRKDAFSRVEGFGGKEDAVKILEAATRRRPSPVGSSSVAKSGVQREQAKPEADKEDGHEP